MPSRDPAGIVGAPVPLTGRYAVQGQQMRLGLELWAAWARRRLVLVDDCSDRARAATVHEELREQCSIVLGPYGSDSTRAVAAAAAGRVVWNHGAAADDVQRLPGVVSMPSPASRYLAAVADLLPVETRIVVAAGSGRFAQHAATGIGRPVVARLPLAADTGSVLTMRPEAVLVCGPLAQELAALRALRRRAPSLVLAGVSPGLAAFPQLLGADPDGILAPVHWHADLLHEPTLGPAASEVVAAADGPLDYVAAQAYAAALIAAHCLELEPDDPLGAARRLRPTTFFGRFELAPDGLQIGHRLAVVRWRSGRQKLVHTGCEAD